MKEMQCELLEKCGFFVKFSNSMELACKGFIARYCKGPEMHTCERKKYRQEHGAPPPDNMLPSGKMINI